MNAVKVFILWMVGMQRFIATTTTTTSSQPGEGPSSSDSALDMELSDNSFDRSDFGYLILNAGPGIKRSKSNPEDSPSSLSSSSSSSSSPPSSSSSSQSPFYSLDANVSETSSDGEEKVEEVNTDSGSSTSFHSSGIRSSAYLKDIVMGDDGPADGESDPGDVEFCGKGETPVLRISYRESIRDCLDGVDDGFSFDEETEFQLTTIRARFYSHDTEEDPTITESFALNTDIFKTPFVVRFEKMENPKRNYGYDNRNYDVDDAEPSTGEGNDPDDPYPNPTSPSGFTKAVSKDNNLAYVGIDKHGVSLISEDGETIIEINNHGASMKRKDGEKNVYEQKLETEKSARLNKHFSVFETTPSLSHPENGTGYSVRVNTLPSKRLTRRPKQSKANGSSSTPSVSQSSETIRLYEVDSRPETNLNTFQVDELPDDNKAQFDKERNKAKLKLINAGLILAVSVCLLLFVVLGAFLVMRGCDMLGKDKSHGQPRPPEIEPRFIGRGRNGGRKDGTVPPDDPCAKEKQSNPDEALISSEKEKCNTIEWYV